jgi:hypothetical protein
MLSVSIAVISKVDNYRDQMALGKMKLVKQ